MYLQNFKGNKNVTSIVANKLDPPIIARYVRVHPGYYKENQACLRLELYGCPLEDPKYGLLFCY